MDFATVAIVVVAVLFGATLLYGAKLIVNIDN